MDLATSDEESREKMLKSLKKKKTSILIKYKKAQKFFKDEQLECKNIDEELKTKPEDPVLKQIENLARGLKHILSRVKADIRKYLLDPNLNANEEEMRKVVFQKKKKRKGGPNTSDNPPKKACLVTEQPS